MSLPHEFTSQLQLEEYVKCLRNIKIGDEIEFYLYIDDSGISEYNKPSISPTATTANAFVVWTSDIDPDTGWSPQWNYYDPGLKFPFILLGSNRYDIGFMNKREWIPAITNTIDNNVTKKYYNYMLVTPSRILIKRIIKSK